MLRKLARILVNLYLILFFTFGYTAPVYAAEASEAAKLVSEEASRSAELISDGIVEVATKVFGKEIPRFRLPFEGDFPVSLGFGENYEDQNLIDKLGDKAKNGHDGIDFELPEETSVLAVDDGEVVIAGEGDFGITIKIIHPWGDSVYGHLKEVKVIIGQKVTKGQEIALSGSTGIVNGSHLHFGIKPKNPVLSYMFGFIDPKPYLGGNLLNSNVIASEASQSRLNSEIKIATNSSTLQSEISGVATTSATENKIATSSPPVRPRNDSVLEAENIATDSAYLFNYKFDLAQGATAHFFDKKTKRPSFAIADENYEHKLRFFLKGEGESVKGKVSEDPKVENNKVEYPVIIQGIPMTLRYTVEGQRVKEEFVINQRPEDSILASQVVDPRTGSSTLQIPFDVNVVGLEMEKQGGKYVFKSKDGKVSWTIHEATVEDSKGRKGTAEEVGLEVGQHEAVLSVSTDYLKNASYPIIIDPTWTQTDWSGGSGTSTTNQFSSSSSVTTSTSGQATLTAASSWMDTSWKYRRKITLANTDANLGVTAETLTNFPVLVKLDSTRVDYSNTQGSGQDIRFTDSDGTTTLSHEIESWDESGSSYVWVKIPSIDTTGSDYIYVYYGNSSVADGQSATNVWDSSYLGVWHLKETGNGTAQEYKDSKNNTSSTNGQGGGGTAGAIPSVTTSGMFGSGQTFDGGNDYIKIPTLSYNNDVTFSAWVKGGSQTASDWNYWINIDGSVSLEYGTFSNGTVFKDNGAAGTPSVGGGTTTDNSWHLVTGTISTTTMRNYVDGAVKGTNTSYPGGQTHSNQHNIGGVSGTTTRGWAGTIDEARISNTARSAAWIAAEYKSGTDAFNSFASEEAQVATSGTLTSAVFDAGASYDWTTMSYSITTPSNTSGSVKVRSGNQSDLSDATAFSSCTAITSGDNLSTGGCVTNGHRYVQYQVSLANTDAVSTATFSDISINYQLTAPSALSGSPASSSSITWSWTDNSSAESGFYVQDTDGNTKCTVSSASTTTCTESSLSPNTSYTRRVVAYNASGNSSASSNASAITLSTAPTTSNITSNRSTSTWYNTSSFTFTNGIGFGAGGVQYLRYVWDTSSTHTWTGSETQWTSSTLTTTATSEGNSWYLHLKGYNSNDTENGTLDFGPFYYDATNPASVSLDSPGDSTYTSSERPTFKWKAATTPDATAGLSKYQLALVDKDSTQYILIDSIPTDRTTDYETSQYLIHYDGFSDSDSTNNYISIYTKTSSSWATGANDGKLKTGKNTWKIIAVDNAGNTKEESRTIYGDFANPSLTSASIESVGEKDGYYITTNFNPVVSGTVTDDVAPDKIILEFYKFSYFLGVETGKSLNVSKTSSLSNSSDKTSMDFKIQLGQNIDGGKYELLVKGYDKAGNTTSQTIKFQLMNADQAKSLLDAEKLTDQQKDQLTQTSLSLVELEKKAKLRKEKEAAELDKFIASIKEQVGGASNVIGNLYQSTTAWIPVLLGASSTFAGMTREKIEIAASVISSGIATIGDGIMSANQYIDNTQGILTQQIRKDYGSLTYSITSNGNNAIASIVGGIENTREAVVLTTTESIILVTTAMKATGQSIQESGQNLVSATNAGISVLNSNLVKSEEQAKKQAAQFNRGASQNLQNAGEAVKVAWRGIQKPVQNTADFLDRVKIGVLTFESIVFDKEPTRISDVTIEDIGQDYAVISWKTNHYATGKVNYGKDLSYGEEVVLEKREKYHKARLVGLKPGERVFFEVMSQNKNYAYDAYYSFETLGE